MDTDSLDTNALLSGSEGFLAGISLWTLFFGFAFSVFGIAFFRRGRKIGNYGLIGIGIALMVYPYFVYNPWAVFGLGSALCFGAYRIWNN
mgnify:CR=1 FL=1